MLTSKTDLYIKVSDHLDAMDQTSIHHHNLEVEETFEVWKCFNSLLTKNFYESKFWRNYFRDKDDIIFIGNVAKNSNKTKVFVWAEPVMKTDEKYF